MPRTERNGRVHSSTVTVAVLSVGPTGNSMYDRREPTDFDIQWYNGTIGAGGQNHQKTANCARITHLPSGIVKTAQTRSRQNSLKNALAALHAALDEQAASATDQMVNGIRRSHVGSGERSDRRRTYQFQNGAVVDHKTGHRIPIDRIMAGRFELLW